MKVHHHTLEGFKNEVLRRRIRQVRKDYYHEGDSAELDVSGRKSRIAYTLTVYDETHRLPANTFSRLATVKTKLQDRPFSHALPRGRLERIYLRPYRLPHRPRLARVP